MDPMLPLLRDFLRDHPEHVPGVKQATIDGEEQTVVATDTLAAFCGWLVETKQDCNHELALRFRDWLNSQFPNPVEPE